VTWEGQIKVACLSSLYFDSFLSTLITGTSSDAKRQFRFFLRGFPDEWIGSLLQDNGGFKKFGCAFDLFLEDSTTKRFGFWSQCRQPLGAHSRLVGD
jgi:hypothetical protein